MIEKKRLRPLFFASIKPYHRVLILRVGFLLFVFVKPLQALVMTMNSTAAPTTRLSLFYGLYFALLGCIAPYWGLYLTELSFTPQEIGSLMALFGTVRILAPNLWAYWGRNISAPLRMVRVAGLLTLFSFGGIFLVDSFTGIACIMVLYGFFLGGDVTAVRNNYHASIRQ